MITYGMPRSVADPLSDIPTVIVDYSNQASRWSRVTDWWPGTLEASLTTSVPLTWPLMRT